MCGCQGHLGAALLVDLHRSSCGHLQCIVFLLFSGKLKPVLRLRRWQEETHHIHLPSSTIICHHLPSSAVICHQPALLRKLVPSAKVPGQNTAPARAQAERLKPALLTVVCRAVWCRHYVGYVTWLAKARMPNWFEKHCWVKSVCFGHCAPTCRCHTAPLSCLEPTRPSMHVLFSTTEIIWYNVIQLLVQ